MFERVSSELQEELEQQREKQGLRRDIEIISDFHLCSITYDP